MKLSKTQLRLLEYMNMGGIYNRLFFGGDSWGHWAGIAKGPRPTVNILSIEKLQGLGLIECHKEDWHSKYYRITDKGLWYLRALT